MAQIIEYPLTADERRPFRRHRVDDVKVGAEELGTILILPVIHIDRPPSSEKDSDANR